MSDKWYLHADRYWIPPSSSADYPLRQGDIVRSRYLTEELGWEAGMIVHPTCEIAKTSVTELQLVEVMPLAKLSSDFDRALVTAGFQEKNGHRQVAVAHTFFLAPTPDDTRPAFANFRKLEAVPQDDAELEHRVAAMTHGCRVSFIRRWLYFRFRVTFSMDDVLALEAARIRADPDFQGPKPSWSA